MKQLGKLQIIVKRNLCEPYSKKQIGLALLDKATK